MVSLPTFCSSLLCHLIFANFLFDSKLEASHAANVSPFSQTDQCDLRYSFALFITPNNINTALLVGESCSVLRLIRDMKRREDCSCLQFMLCRHPRTPEQSEAPPPPTHTHINKTQRKMKPCKHKHSFYSQQQSCFLVGW